MGRGSHRAERNRNRALQTECVRPALGYCLLLGKAGGLAKELHLGCGSAAVQPLKSDPTSPSR